VSFLDSILGLATSYPDYDSNVEEVQKSFFVMGKTTLTARLQASHTSPHNIKNTFPPHEKTSGIFTTVNFS
jgi:hypothetical protein